MKPKSAYLCTSDPTLCQVGTFAHISHTGYGQGVESEWFRLYSTQKNRASAAYLRDFFPPRFQYQDFGPMLTMDFWNADKVADIVADSGAKYLVFTSKHHDGFCNWPSAHSYGWNSMAVGPKRDVIGELSAAVRNRHPDVKFGVYYSLFEWFNPMWLKDKATGFRSREFALNKILPEMKELAEKYAPDVWWSDGDWDATADYFGSKDFLAWLYNDSPAKDSVVTNDRWGRGCEMHHGGFFSGPDRFDPGTLQAHKWESCMTVDKMSWGYRRNIDIADVFGMNELVTKVENVQNRLSCNGLLIGG